MRAWGVALLGLVAASPAWAQSFPCERARTPIEKAICATATLGNLDRQVAGAYADALRREPGNAAAIRAAQAQWLRARDTACAVPAPRLAECLAQQMTGRLAALAPAPDMSPTPVAQAAPAPPREPAIPQLVPPEPAAVVEQAAHPAASLVGTLLRVTSPGRFTVRTQSATGASLQLVDMLAGPSDESGVPGAADGRLDVLLDVGAYKLRARMADGASGEVRFLVAPSKSAAAPASVPAPGVLASSTLADGETRWFWLQVPPGGALRVEAAGRALADLRLWRNGTELADLQPEAATIEPARGRPLTRMRLSGKVEPGAYLVAAYGGPALAWPDGAVDQPFHLREGVSDALALGWAGGQIGPMGSEVFAAPADRTGFRLDLPTPAAAALSVDGQAARILPASREPSATVLTGSNRAVVEVTGAAGQAYTLRALQVSSAQSWSQPGTWWVSASAVGTGGDEVPPTVLLGQQESGQPSRLLASSVPSVSAQSPLRLRFNLRGPTSFWVWNDMADAMAVRQGGTDVGTLSLRPNAFNEVPGFARRYSLSPVPGKVGVADILLGREGAAPPAPLSWPADPVVPLGVQSIGPQQRLALYGNDGPGVRVGLVVRAAPVALAEGPLAVTQVRDALDVPVTAPPGGQLVVAQPGVGDVPHAVRTDTDGSQVVTLPATDRPRTVVLAWRRAASPRPDVVLPPVGADRTALQAGVAQYFDLGWDRTREFTLTVPDGGLYRVETLGRLQTTGAIGTAFLPGLGRAQANGVGQNMLLQQWLRAGQYRVAVSASNSAGRAGILAAPAPLSVSPELLPGGSVRARLAGGAGLRVPVVVAETGRYTLDVRGLGREFLVRLDDAEGWPLLAPQRTAVIEQDLPAGRYSLVVSPEAVDARVVARLARVLPEPDRAGHGPHALPFEATERNQWREPPGRTDPRAPDVWTFVLHGPADATLRISAGMAADLKRDGDERPVARLIGPAPFKGQLAAGSYRLEAASLGRNDRLDYTVRLSTAELQPGAPRAFGVAASVPFSLAEPRVVSLTSFGDVPMKAVLRDGAGAELARYGDRGSDWNLAMSRPLPAGRYRLDLQPAVPPASTPTSKPRYRSSEPDSDAEDNAAAMDDGGAPQTAEAARPYEAPDRPETDGEPDARTTDLRLALPDERAPQPAGPAATLPGGGVNRMVLDRVEPGSLVLATASSPAELVLALERRDGEGWRTVGLAQGTSPVVAAPADGSPAQWRASLWAVDGGAEPVRAALQAVSRPAQGLGDVTPAAVDGAAAPIGAARVAPGAPGLLDLGGAGVLAGGWPGHALERTEGTLAPQSDTVWLVGPVAPVPVAARPAVPGLPLAVPVPAGGWARLAASPVPAGHVRAWVAQAGLGQPGLDAGQGMGVAPGSALAVGPVAEAWGADGGALAPRVTALDLLLQPARALHAPFAGLVAAGEAASLTLPPGAWQVSLALAPGVGAVVGHGGPDPQTVWGGEAAVSRVLTGGGDVLLLNTGDAPAPAALSWLPGGAEPLQPGQVVRRFFGAPGSFDLPLATAVGQTLVLAGEGTAVVTGRDGQVRRGRRVALSGPGRLTVEHPAGPVAAWVEADGVSPWPAVDPVPAELPVRMPLSGAAMALRVQPGGPALLRARTTAPVLLRVGGGAPELFAAGADISRYVAGDTVLRLDSPHDGPLSGTLQVSADPVATMAEGLGTPVTLAPNGTAAWGFRLSRATDVGVGVRAEPDRAALRLLDASGAVVGEGNAQLRRLAPGQYVLEARNAGDTAAVLRPALLGIAPRGSGLPPEVAQRYLELAGLAPRDAPKETP